MSLKGILKHLLLVLKRSRNAMREWGRDGGGGAGGGSLYCCKWLIIQSWTTVGQSETSCYLITPPGMRTHREEENEGKLE